MGACCRKTETPVGRFILPKGLVMAELPERQHQMGNPGSNDAPLVSRIAQTLDQWLDGALVADAAQRLRGFPPDVSFPVIERTDQRFDDFRIVKVPQRFGAGLADSAIASIQRSD